jgi:hypothetical protein
MQHTDNPQFFKVAGVTGRGTGAGTAACDRPTACASPGPDHGAFSEVQRGTLQPESRSCHAAGARMMPPEAHVFQDIRAGSG